MKCRKPFSRGVEEYGCGQCIPCRINRRRIWTFRLMLEALVHEKTAFVTLTYADEHMPDGGSLVPSDLQLFLKRLRKNVSPVRVRFFGVGEYGDDTERPHYHLALYGVAGEGDPRASALPAKHPQRFERRMTVIDESWQLGNVHLGELNVTSAQYLCGYVVKKLTSSSNPYLGGRFPEFARMSLRPGIGALAIEDVGRSLSGECGWDYVKCKGDVPSVLRQGGKYYPLGRYLRRMLRRNLGFKELGEPEGASLERQKRLQDLYASYVADEKVGSITGRPNYALGKQRADEADQQRCLSAETRLKIRKARKL